MSDAIERTYIKRLQDHQRNLERTGRCSALAHSLQWAIERAAAPVSSGVSGGGDQGAVAPAAPDGVREARALAEWTLANGYDRFSWRMTVQDDGKPLRMVVEARPEEAALPPVSGGGLGEPVAWRFRSMDGYGSWSFARERPDYLNPEAYRVEPLYARQQVALTATEQVGTKPKAECAKQPSHEARERVARIILSESQSVVNIASDYHAADEARHIANLILASLSSSNGGQDQ